jgi:hypothetical protein
MARIREPGTSATTRTKKLVYPDRSRRLVWIGLGGGLIVLVGSMVLYLAGQRAVLSPGDVAAHHSRIDLKCAQCHTTASGVESLRCERCHDPSGSDRMLHSAHVLFGSGDRRLADRADDVGCATCHTDHRGREFALTNVDDRECATCHSFRGLRGHPEFAVVRARASAGVGIDFDHDRHIIEAQKAQGATCQTCHEQTGDRRAFQPMNFDRHCASCHLKGGLFESESDFVAPEFVVAPADVPAPALGGSQVTLSTGARGKLRASGLRHRDGWMLYNAARLRRGIDREGDEAERLALRARIQYLEQIESTPAPRAIPAAEIDAAIAALQDEIAGIDARLAPRSGNDEDATALQELTAAAQAVASSLASVGGSIEPTPAAAPAPAGQSDPEADARLARRKAELLALIDAIAQRAPESPAAKRAAELRSEIEGLAGSGGDSSQDDSAAIAERLDRLGDLLLPVRGVPDEGVRAELGGIEAIRQLAIERAGGGLSREDFEGRRRDLLALLDGIEQRGGDAVRARVTMLRQRVLALSPGTSGDDATVRRRKQRQRQLDRLVIERELAASKGDADDPPAQDASIDRAELGRALARARTRLAEIERAPRMTAPATEDERLARANALEALLTPCLKCHELDASRARMAPVRIAEPVMARSIFNHAPHVTDTTCESCHGGVRTSKFATDVNVPGVAECQTCHNPSQVRATCATCHVYHPPSAVRLAVAQR